MPCETSCRPGLGGNLALASLPVSGAHNLLRQSGKGWAVVSKAPQGLSVERVVSNEALWNEV